MQNDFFLSDNRNVYDVFINTGDFDSKNRIFNASDLFPTTLSALNVKIEGDRLGLGTDLFSSTKTLSEEFGIDYVNDEMSKKSFYYDNYILGDSYYEIEKRAYEEERS